MIKTFLVHGFNVTDGGEATVGRMRNLLHAYGMVHNIKS